MRQHCLKGDTRLALPFAGVLHKANAARLPVTFTFLQFQSGTPGVAHPVHVTTPGGRESLRAAVDPQLLLLRTSIRRHGWLALVGSYLHMVVPDTNPVEAVVSYPAYAVWSLAKERVAVEPVSVVLHKPKNTSVLERNWRSLNRFRWSLQQLSGERMGWTLLRVMASQNDCAIRQRVSGWGFS